MNLVPHWFEFWLRKTRGVDRAPARGAPLRAVSPVTLTDQSLRLPKAEVKRNFFNKIPDDFPFQWIDIAVSGSVNKNLRASSLACAVCFFLNAELRGEL